MKRRTTALFCSSDAMGTILGGDARPNGSVSPLVALRDGRGGRHMGAEPAGGSQSSLPPNRGQSMPRQSRPKMQRRACRIAVVVPGPNIVDHDTDAISDGPGYAGSQ